MIRRSLRRKRRFKDGETREEESYCATDGALRGDGRRAGVGVVRLGSAEDPIASSTVVPAPAA